MAGATSSSARAARAARRRRSTARRLAAILEGAARGQRVLSAQHFDVLHAVAHGDDIALEVQWTGTLAMALGALAAGDDMRARFGVFIPLRDGKIAAQRNYDCFDPF